MRLTIHRTLIFPALVVGLHMSPWESGADQSDSHMIVGDAEIYIGVLPVEIILGRSGAGHEQMHGGTPANRDSYHLVVALFDRETGSRIAAAQISAALKVPGMAISEKTLEPMRISGVVTYDNYFTMSSRLENHVELLLDVSGTPLVRAQFQYSAGR